MTDLSKADVEKVAKLARLRIRPERMSAYLKDLNDILHTVEHLEGLDTDSIDPVVNLTDQDMYLRTDEVTDGDKLKDILSNAPKEMLGCFVVPKVVE